MTPQEFAYWLQGLFEIADPKTLDEKQTAIIKEHLQLVFKKVTCPAKPAAQPQRPINDPLVSPAPFVRPTFPSFPDCYPGMPTKHPLPQLPEILCHHDTGLTREADHLYC